MRKHLLLSAIWTVAITACVAVVKLTSIGPVVFVISEERGLGVHTGDSLILIPLLVAAVATAAIVNKKATA